MKLRRPLWVKLLAGYLLAALASVGLVAILANRTTTHQFELYVSQGKQLRAERLAPSLAAYYAQSGSWAGADVWLADQGAALVQDAGQGPGAGRGQGVAAGDRVIVVGVDGLVVGDSQGTLVGGRLSTAQLAQGVPLLVDGLKVGTLLVPADPAAYQSLERQFLSRVNRSLLWAGLGAAAVALILGVALARQFTAPIRALTHAAQQMTRPHADAGPAATPPQVQIRSHDELGQLGQAFNEMSASLTRQETMRRNLMADIAHELRTPLTVMRGDLEALLDGVYQSSPEALASLHEEAVLLSRLVDDLRALAQAEAGQLRLEREPTDLGKLLAAVVSAFDLLAESQGQKLRLDLPPDLTPVEVDPQRMRQVVANLVSNALRHAGGPGSQVVVGAVQTGGETEIWVMDDGPGIPAEDLPHLFDRFWQADRARGEGSGLGLAIARGLVLAHGGRIWADSAPGRGTAFHVTL